MVEWVTRPYYSPVGAVYEARLLEGCLANALYRTGRAFGERLHYFHGNLLETVPVDHQSIPGGWNLAKRRYLEHCIDLYGGRNWPLPESTPTCRCPSRCWPGISCTCRPSERGNEHLDSYKNQVYIEGTRLMRAFASPVHRDDGQHAASTRDPRRRSGRRRSRTSTRSGTSPFPSPEDARPPRPLSLPCRLPPPLL